MIKSIGTKFENYLNRYAVVKTRQLLLTMDGEILERAGISSELLHRGVAHWPWHNEEKSSLDLSVAAIGVAADNREAGYADAVAKGRENDYSIEETTGKAA